MKALETIEHAQIEFFILEIELAQLIYRLGLFKTLWENEIKVYMNICSTHLKLKKCLTYISPETAELRIWMTLKEMTKMYISGEQDF